jgi:tRNA(His) 5'-end guanylyltransferase
MAHWDDSLGEMMKGFERVETERAAAPGEAVVVRVDGHSFTNFTSHMARPFDERFSRAMVEATRVVVEDLKCRIGYTQSDEATFILWEPEGDLPFGGKFQKLATVIASKFTGKFILEGLKLFPEAIESRVPAFDGRSHALPFPDYAARNVLWRETDARKNSLNGVARANFSQNVLNGKSSQQMKEMLAEKGYDLGAVPESFRRGVFLRRVIETRPLTPEERAKIPEGHKVPATVKRARVAEVPMPHLSFVENLAEVILHGEEPVLRPCEGFVAAVAP